MQSSTPRAAALQFGPGWLEVGRHSRMDRIQGGRRKTRFLPRELQTLGVRGSRCRSSTLASGSRPRIRSASSTNSSRSTRDRVVIRCSGALAWAWRSRDVSLGCWAATLPLRVNPGKARRSPCGSRYTRPTSSPPHRHQSRPRRRLARTPQLLRKRAVSFESSPRFSSSAGLLAPFRNSVANAMTSA